MSNVIITPNMSLTVPVVGVDPGPDYASNVNGSLIVLDAHNHTPGSGLQITPAAININSDLAFNNFNATTLRTTRFTSQSAVITGASPDLSCLYSVLGELYFNDGAGNNVKITNSGTVNATSSGITSGAATASFVAGILTVDSATSTPGSIDVATVLIRYPGSYPSVAGNYIALQAPSSLATAYAFTFPATTPGANGAFLTSSTGGALSYTNVDNSTVEINAASLRVKAQGITATQIADQTITPTQLQAMALQTTTATLGNVAISTSVSTSTSSTNFVEISSSLRVTLTTSGRPIFLQCICRSTSTSGYFSIPTSGAQMTLKVVRNPASTIDTVNLIEIQADNSSVHVPPGAVTAIDVPTAGAHVYSIFWETNGPTISCVAIQLMAYEL